ncbi:MAG TPA: hypothetical protein VIY86_11710, partial [Pirellulaceae bacterium]
LAGILLEEGLVDAVRMGDEPETVVVSTRRPTELFQRLPRLVQERHIELRGLESTDDSLQSLFDKLLRMHRGEL